MDESVKYYIQQARRTGYEDFEIKQSLLQGGWNEEYIDLTLGQMPGSVNEAPEKRAANLKTWLKNYYQEYSAQIALVGLVTTGATLFSLFAPWTLKFLVDSVFDSVPAPGFLEPYTRSITLLTIVSFFLLGAFIAEHGLRLYASRLSRKYSNDFDRLLKTRFFTHIMRLPIKYKSKLLRDNYLLDQLSKTSDVTKLVIELPVSLVGAGIGILGAFVIMFSINIPLAIVTLLIMPALYGASRTFEVPLNTSKKELEEKEAAIYQHSAESIVNIQAVQSFNRQDTQAKTLLELMNERLTSKIHRMHVKQGYEFVRGLIVIVGIFTILYVGGRQIFINTMTLGELLIFLYYINTFYGPLEVFLKGLTELRSTASGVQRFYDLMFERSDVDTQDKRGLKVEGFKQGLVLNQMQISRDDQLVISDASLTIKPGQKVGFIGATGSGKSSLLETIAQFVDYTSGSITFDDVELKDLNIKNIREQMTFINQEPQLFSDSILNNILYSVDRSKSNINSTDVVNAVTQADALAFVEGLPNNYETNLGEAVQFLTEAQRLKLSLARAFLRNSPILIMDEPTNALDVQAEKEVMLTIYRLMEDRTVILASNKLSLLTQMDNVYVIEGGKVMDVQAYGGIDRYMSYLSRHELI